MWKRLCLLALLMLGLIVTGCGVEGTRLKWKKIADDSGAGEEFRNRRYADSVFAYLDHTPRLIVITELAAVATLQGKMLSPHLEQIAETDFSSFVVAVIHRGKETLTEYHQGIERPKEYSPIEVSDVKLHENAVTIYAQLNKEVFDERHVFNPEISPYYILRIKKPVGMEVEKLDFILSADDEIIPQICAMKGEHLTWEQIVFGRGVGRIGTYRGHSPKLVVIVDRDAVSSVKNQLPPQHLELVSNVDFSTHFVAIIYQGEKETGYSVEMVDVKRQGNSIIVCTQLHDPHPRGLRGNDEISPYHIIKIKKAEELKGRFTFVLIDNSEEISRQTETIP